MLHTIIYGPPGVGKSKVGSILADIWTALGILGQSGGTKVEKPDPLQQRQVESINNTAQVSRHLVDANTNLKVLKKELDKVRGRHLFVNKAQEDIVMTSLKQLNMDLDWMGNIISSEIKADQDYRISNIELPKVSEENKKFVVAHRSDLVAEYLGQTAVKTRKFLNEAKGKVIFIDECYSLINSNDHDSFGMEALTEIIKYMSDAPDSNIFIFAGYKDLVQQTIFKAQPGLERRLTWIFSIEKYEPVQLANIFRLQLEESGWTTDADLNRFFNKEIGKFPNFGGDTSKLVFYCKLAYADMMFTASAGSGLGSGSGSNQETKITSDILDIAYKQYLKVQNNNNSDNNYLSMFL